MTNVEFRCHMIMNFQPCEKKSNQSCALPWHRKECTTWPFWTLSKTLSTKWTLQTLFIYSQLQKPGKDCFCFVLRTYNFGFRSHLFLYKKYLKKSFCCQFNLKRMPIFHFFATFAFSKVICEYKAKVSSRTGAPNIISPVRQGPCGINSALRGDSSKCWIPPPTIDLSSSLQWRPLLATFRLWI